MARSSETMAQLRKVLQDDAVRLKVQEAKDEGAVLRLLNAAGKTEGVKFTKDWLHDVIVDVKLTRWPPMLTEQELLLLSSRGMVGDTAPKLCHSSSCGGHPTSCC